ncbi:hypothetical protein [Sphingomonas taxi]|uniref:hypothetical protein n=1 Tax=Sphingomonas taxi TaxID=1549858 RepID=UPI0012E0599A|nr:hypothetical protein [Sphingomonas taxi]
MIFIHAKARRREEGVSLGMPSGVLDMVFVRAEARRRGERVAGGVLPSIIPNDFDIVLTRKKARAAGGVASSSLLLRASAPLRAKNLSSLRVFAPSRDTIQRAAA